jgi:hypothetical protein
MVKIKPPVDGHAAALKRLGQVLDVPVETFLRGAPEGDASELFALVRL